MFINTPYLLFVLLALYYIHPQILWPWMIYLNAPASHSLVASTKERLQATLAVVQDHYTKYPPSNDQNAADPQGLHDMINKIGPPPSLYLLFQYPKVVDALAPLILKSITFNDVDVVTKISLLTSRPVIPTVSYIYMISYYSKNPFFY